MEEQGYAQVLPFFESLFMVKYPLDDELIYQWFISAIGRYELELCKLHYNFTTKKFEKPLDIISMQLLGYMMLEEFQLREVTRIQSLNGIQSKDLSITGMGDSKRITRLNLQDIRSEINKLLFKLKNNSYQN